MPVTGLAYPFFNGRGWPIVRSPMWKTIVQPADSGKEYRMNTWPSPRWKWKIQWTYLYDDISFAGAETNFAKTQLETLFNQCQGQYSTFYYLDPYDNQIASPIAIGVGDGATTSFRAFRIVQAGAYSASEYIQIFNGVPNVFLNGVANHAFSLTQPPGTIVFASAPGAGVTISISTAASGFFFLCRFLKDSLDFSHDYQGVWSLADLEFQSVLA